MKYDDASWHSEGEFPEGSPVEYAATHIGRFLKWCFKMGWAGELHLEEWPEDVEAVIDGRKSATSFVLQNCDGKFTDEDLSEEGNLFAKQYYGENGLYLEDYSREFVALLYVKPEPAHSYQSFSEMINSRFKSGVLTKAEIPRPTA